MRTAKTVMIAAATALLSSMAVAQPRNPYGGGTRIPEQPLTTPAATHETRIILQGFADCLAKKRPADVQKYLLEDLGERETVALREKILEVNCFNQSYDTQLRLVPLTLQGALAEAMLGQQRLLARPIADLAMVAPLRHSDLSEFPNSLRHASTAELETMKAMDYLFRFGECVSRADITNTYALLTSKPDSPEETGAFSRMGAAFGGCVEKGRTLTADKITMRAAIAYNYYRLASSPRMSTAVQPAAAPASPSPAIPAQTSTSRQERGS